MGLCESPSWGYMNAHSPCSSDRTQHVPQPQAKTIFLLNVLDEETYLEAGLAHNFLGPPLFDHLVKTWLPALAPAEFHK